MFSHFENDLFAQEVILRLYTKFPTMPGTSLKFVCGGVADLNPIIVFSLAQAEQYMDKRYFVRNVLSCLFIVYPFSLVGAKPFKFSCAFSSSWI